MIIAAPGTRTRVSAPHYLRKGLRHSYQIARSVCLLVRRKRQRPTFHIAKAVIKRRELLAKIHNGEVYETAARSPTMFLSSRHHAGSEAGTLRRRSDREQAEITALAPQFHVDASG